MLVIPQDYAYFQLDSQSSSFVSQCRSFSCHLTGRHCPERTNSQFLVGNHKSLFLSRLPFFRSLLSQLYPNRLKTISKARKMNQLIKCLPYKQQYLSSHLSNPPKKYSTVTHTSNSSIWEMGSLEREVPGSSLIHQLNLNGDDPGQRDVVSNKRCKAVLTHICTRHTNTSIYIEWLISTYNSSCRKSDVFLWPLRAPDTHGTRTHTYT